MPENELLLSDDTALPLLAELELDEDKLIDGAAGDVPEDPPPPQDTTPANSTATDVKELKYRTDLMLIISPDFITIVRLINSKREFNNDLTGGVESNSTRKEMCG